MQTGAEQSRQIAFHIFFGRFFQIPFLKTFVSLQNCLSLTPYVHHPYLSHNLLGENTQVTIRLRSSGSTWLYSGFRWLRSSTPNSLNLLSINSIAPYFPFPLFISTFASEKLKEIVIPGTVTNLGDGCFQETFSLQSITLPQNITEIPVSFLERNKNLTSLVIPDNVTVIHDNAFYGPIKEVQMSKNLKRIGKDAFRENFLTEVVLPASIEYIDQGAFRLSDFLERVYCMAKTPPMTAYYNINNDNESYEPFCIFQSNKDLTLYVPVGSGDLYRESPYWVDFDNIVETNDFPSSVGRASATDYQITSFGGEIRVDNPTDMPVSVNIYAINGSLVRQEKVVGTFALTVSPGIYLVKVNDKAQKVLVE
ncbi:MULTISPECIES: leucine-rich repeat domain-containing protein [unclassified Bacteroides]|jgi:hypothetical protein|uniref:leucine-rich repeat domain-containing protein n=1 Tax=unclassified Bacteroides TaxID=2646097 RepID=UPI000E82EBFB|nr:MULTISPECIES: leucine-rich repeat domain-containing protein [unclassified Bacteroides]RGN44408.1 hypothetical protein DXB63_14200 [Bacteroides sp. OM05-12]RHR72062.1 hypothetical protein DWW69_16980 [Bacteroides sp. AF16-49]